jgi:predicted nuclease of restriction endonuclease-like (RecB) superfamily
MILDNFYVFYKNSTIVQQPVEQTSSEIIQQPVGQIDFSNLLTQIPWGHHVLIMNKIKDTQEAGFYIQKTMEWRFRPN